MTAFDDLCQKVAAWRMARSKFVAAEVAPRNPGSLAEQFLRDRAQVAGEALREASMSLVDACRDHGLDVVALRLLARSAIPGTGSRAVAAAEHCAAILDELLVRAAPRRRKRDRGPSLDALACAAVDAFESADSPNRNPEWTLREVAETLGVKPAALNGLQRDKSPRCPAFAARWKVHKARNHKPKPDRRRR